MKKVVNWILYIGIIISIVVVLKYSSLPIPKILSEHLSDFWIISSEEQQKYSLIYDIAIGFLLSALFYFIVDEIPDRVRKYKAKQLIYVQINQLVVRMEQLISIVVSKYNCDTNLKNLAQKDFLVLDGDIAVSREEISYSTIIYNKKSKNRITAVREFGTINMLIKKNLKQIIDDISFIKNYEYFYASDNVLVECIRRIESCRLYQMYCKGNNYTDSPCFQFSGTSNAMIEFINIYFQLVKLKYHTEYSITSLDSYEETIKYHNERESGILLQGVIDIQKKRKEMALLNPTLVISSSKYTTNILISKMRRSLIAIYESIDDLYKLNLEHFKNIVFVVDSVSKNDIIQYLKEKDIQAEIILIIEQKFFPIYIKKNEIINKKIVGKIFFKTCFKLNCLPIVFYKEEPSEKNIDSIILKIRNICYGEKNVVK